jgi:3,5-epimerase/4-reductase
MTVLDDAIPALIKEIVNKRTGTINLVNPGPIVHVTILEMYKKYVNPEHDKLLLSKRSKNVLTPSLDLPYTKDSIEQILKSGSFKKL